MSQPPDYILNSVIVVEKQDTEVDYIRRAKLARRIVEYKEFFENDFVHDNWNTFELEFLESMEDKVDCYGDTLLLTAKQEEVLERIIEKYSIP